MSLEITPGGLSNRQHQILTLAFLAVGLLSLVAIEATEPAWYSKVFVVVGMFSASVAVWRSFVRILFVVSNDLNRIFPKEINNDD